SPQILVVRPSLAVNDPMQHVANARASAGGLAIGLTGRGTIGHLFSELLNGHLGLRVNYFPYLGGSPALRDLIAGHIDGMFTTLPAVPAAIRSGQVVGVGVSSPRRSKAFPEIPTF